MRRSARAIRTTSAFRALVGAAVLMDPATALWYTKYKTNLKHGHFLYVVLGTVILFIFSPLSIKVNLSHYARFTCISLGMLDIPVYPLLIAAHYLTTTMPSNRYAFTVRARPPASTGPRFRTLSRALFNPCRFVQCQRYCLPVSFRLSVSFWPWSSLPHDYSCLCLILL